MEGSVYLKARQEWDERYADLVLGKRNWQLAAAGLMVITLVLAFGMVWLSTRSRFVPYVVEVDKLGYALAAPSALTESTAQIKHRPDDPLRAGTFIRNGGAPSATRGIAHVLRAGLAGVPGGSQKAGDQRMRRLGRGRELRYE